MGRIKQVEVTPEGLIVMTEHWALRATDVAGQREFHRVRTHGWSSGIRSVPLLRVIARRRTMLGVLFPERSWRRHERFSGSLEDAPVASASSGLATSAMRLSLFGVVLVHGLQAGLTRLLGVPLSPFSLAYHGLMSLWFFALLHIYWRLVLRVPEVQIAMRRSTAAMRSVALDELGEPPTVDALRVARSHPLAGTTALGLMGVLAPFVFFVAALPLRAQLASCSWSTQWLAVIAVHWLALTPLVAIAGELQGVWVWLWRRGMLRRVLDRLSVLWGPVRREPTEDDLELVSEAVNEALWLEARDRRE